MPSTGIPPGPASSEPGRRAGGGAFRARRRRLWNGAASWSWSGMRSVPSCSIQGSRGDASARAALSAASSRLGSAGRSTGGLRMNLKQLEHILRACGSIAGCSPRDEAADLPAPTLRRRKICRITVSVQPSAVSIQLQLADGSARHESGGPPVPGLTADS